MENITIVKPEELVNGRMAQCGSMREDMGRLDSGAWIEEKVAIWMLSKAPTDMDRLNK